MQSLYESKDNDNYATIEVITDVDGKIETIWTNSVNY